MDNININGVRVSPKPQTQTTAVLGAAPVVGDAVTMTGANAFGRGHEPASRRGHVERERQPRHGG